MTNARQYWPFPNGVTGFFNDDGTMDFTDKFNNPITKDEANAIAFPDNAGGGAK